MLLYSGVFVCVFFYSQVECEFTWRWIVGGQPSPASLLLSPRNIRPPGSEALCMGIGIWRTLEGLVKEQPIQLQSPLSLQQFCELAGHAPAPKAHRFELQDSLTMFTVHLVILTLPNFFWNQQRVGHDFTQAKVLHGWRPWLLGWRPSLLGWSWRSSLIGIHFVRAGRDSIHRSPWCSPIRSDLWPTLCVPRRPNQLNWRARLKKQRQSV